MRRNEGSARSDESMMVNDVGVFGDEVGWSAVAVTQCSSVGLLIRGYSTQDVNWTTIFVPEVVGGRAVIKTRFNKRMMICEGSSNGNFYTRTSVIDI